MKNFSKIFPISGPSTTQASTLTEDLLNSFQEVKQVNKKKLLLMDGNVCRNIYIIKKGAIKQYYLLDGKEFVQNIFFEGDIVCDFDSFLNQTTSNSYLEALEDSELLVFSYNEYRKECEENSEISQQLSIYLSKINTKRMRLLLINNSIERYELFLDKEPEILQRVPQYTIASYLCIVPETLSRIRRKVATKQRA